MSGLQSTQPDSAIAASGPQKQDSSAPQLRVVAPDVTGGHHGKLLEQFDEVLGCGDLSRARDVLLQFRDYQQSEHNRLQQSRNEIVQAAEELQQLLDERCRAHGGEMTRQKQQLTLWHEQEKQARLSESARALAEIQEARDEWQAERDKEAALLVAERTRMQHLEETLQAGQSALDRQRAELVAEREALSGELNARRSEFEHLLKQEHEERQSLLDSARIQKESEWQERQSQLEHELTTQRTLHEKQLSLDRESFLQACADREQEFEAVRSELHQQREQLIEERCLSAEEFAQTRQQIEQDRKLLQNGLRQMESQLRWVASSLSLNGGPLPSTGSEQIASATGATCAASLQTDETSLPTVGVPETTSDVTPPDETCNEHDVEEDAATGWTGVVQPRSSEADDAESEDCPATEADTDTDTVCNERRLRLEEYRSQLAALQNSLRSLQKRSSEKPAADSTSSPDTSS